MSCRSSPVSSRRSGVAPVAGALAGRFGGKYILFAGLLLFAAGMAYIAWSAHADSGRWIFLPGLLAGGLGMGCIWAPLFSVAMGDMQPHLAGVASGVLNTIQELGGVLASASVGALLQNRLATALHDQAVHYGSQIPAPYRGHFVAGFSNAASSGFEVGRGQTGGSLRLPPDVPPRIVQQLQHLAEAVFTHGFVDAMRPTLILPILILLPAALCCLAIRRQDRAADARQLAARTPESASVA
ncbi:MAG TPA: MFS transporter [Chloroflexota bacterium]|nr:MFS transporter [Chloroflexota bacterium]